MPFIAYCMAPPIALILNAYYNMEVKSISIQLQRFRSVHLLVHFVVVSKHCTGLPTGAWGYFKMSESLFCDGKVFHSHKIAI